MKKHFRNLGLVLVGLALSNVALADGVKQSGSFEGGWQIGTTSGGGTKGSHFLVDGAHLHWTAELSEKTTVVLNKAIGVNSGGTFPGAGIDGWNYFSPRARLTSNQFGTTPTFILALEEAYLDWEGFDGFTMRVGFAKTPFGMENMWERYQMHSYYYSTAYTRANSFAWNQSLGLSFILKNILPGTLEVNVNDGRANNTGVITPGGAPDNTTPGLAARWHKKIEMDAMNITPMASTYLGRWSGGPSDLGVSAGLMWDMGMIWANAEFIMVNNSINPNSSSPKAKARSIILEPGVNLGDMAVSAKLDIATTGTDATTNTDMNLALAFTKKYGDDYRIRLAFQQSNLSKKLGASVTDVRLLFGSSW